MHGSREAVYQGSHCNVNKRNLAQLPGLSSPGKLLTATAAATAGAEVYFVNKAARFAGAARALRSGSGACWRFRGRSLFLAESPASLLSYAVK